MAESISLKVKQNGISAMAFKPVGQETQLHLMPLLMPSHDIPNASFPPLSRLPIGGLPKERIAFQTKSKDGMTNWVESMHVFPSAYPRWQGGLYPSSEKAAINSAKELVSHHQPQLWSKAYRIVPVRPCTEGGQSILPKGTRLTIVVTQIGRMDKTIWEGVLCKTAYELECKEKQSIEEIWILTGDLMEQETSYEDHIRDVQQFVQFYLPIPNSEDELRQYGPNWPSTILSKQRKSGARKGRKLIGFGHVCPTKLELFDGTVAILPNTEANLRLADKVESMSNGSIQSLNDSNARL